jgi:parvulin-like peptidyl-prolyl isomerase
MTKLPRGLSAFCAVGIVLLANSCSKPEGVVVARVGKEFLTRDQLQALVPPEIAAHAGREVYLDLTRRWIRSKLLANEARRLEYDDNLEVRRRIREKTDEVLGQFMLDRILDTLPEVPEAALRKYYEENQQEFLRQEPEVGFRKIRLADQATAASMRMALSPANFAAEAQRLNPDPSAPAEAQRLWKRSELPPTMAEVLFSLQEGQISPPVQIPDGWGLLLLQTKAAVGSVRTFQEVSDLIRLRLAETERRRRIDEVVAQLSRQSGVEIVSQALPGSDSATGTAPAKK